MNKYKTYLFIKFELTSPLSIGSGKSEETDKDVLVNSKGEPYIPGSALAGVYTQFFDKNETDEYFGYVDVETNDDKKKNGNDGNRPKSAESKLIIYDAVLSDEKEKNQYNTGIRNGVGLDEFRTAKAGAKFDFEVVNPGVKFWTAAEYTAIDEKTAPINKIASIWNSEKLIIGSKTTRGMGRIKCLEMRTKTFKLPEDKDKWLDFDIYSEELKALEVSQMEKFAKENLIDIDSDNTTDIKITLKQKASSAIAVRVYTTEVSENGETAPDYGQLTFKNNNEKDIVVIPGTSWAGTFRHSMAKILCKCNSCTYKEAEAKLEELYGKAEGNASKSKIYFSETYFSNGSSKSKVISRNAIDRFSGGAKDTALFTEKVYYGGTDGILNISIPRDIDEKLKKALAVSIADLNEGFLAVGGESSVGRGLLDITQIEMSGKSEILSGREELSGTSIYEYIMKGEK